MRVEDLVGRQLGRYVVKGLLGRGGMAAVFEAEDTILRRSVALKVLYGQYLSDASLVERFRREAILAARLEHPNIVPIYDVGDSDGLVYIAMKLLAGRSLQDELLLNNDMAPETTLNIVSQVAAALDYAHSRHVVHRDIKPGNVFLNDDGRVMLTDFGIAKSLDTPGMTSTGVIIGTPDYMAPEQIDAKIGAVDAHADIYSLAIMTYRMLTGDRPFDGSTTDILIAHLTRPAQLASERNPYLPPSIDAVLSRAMAKNPAERTSSAGGFARELKEAIGNSTAVGEITPPPARQASVAVIPSIAAEAMRQQTKQAVAPMRRKRGSTLPILAMLGLFMLASLLLVAWTISKSSSRQQAMKAELTATANGFATSEAEFLASGSGKTQITQIPTAGNAATNTAPLPTTTSTTGDAQPTTTQAQGGVVVQPQPTAVTVIQPTPKPLATAIPPTPKPQPTTVPPPPPTNTSPPAPTAKPACQGPLQGGFGALWRANPDIAQALGCPTAGEVGGTASIQYFDGGMMYWWQNNDQIYVYYGGASGSWQRYPNPNDPSYNEPRESDVPAGKIEPIRGFGTLWHTIDGIRSALGWGNSPEYPITGVVQFFPNGMMVYSPPLEGRSARIWVMYNDGSWARYVDPNG